MADAHSFVDEATIEITSGAGGDGAVSFRRERFAPHGGPDGGNGGRGGDIVFVADAGMNTLHGFRSRRHIRAESGHRGGSSNKTGASGADIILRVPLGTLLYPEDAPEGAKPLADLSQPTDRFTAARGGRGGAGNACFATATRQVPDFAKPGQPSQVLRLRLSLKLLADVGLVGFPNAGKSTLLSRISAARPRVASYPFTTLVPALGVVEFDEERFVVADVPGLIEGASDGAGLGDRFLRHVERTRVLVHLLDVAAMLFEDRDLVVGYDAIRSELANYQPALLERREIIVLNKLDLTARDEDRAAVDACEAQLRGRGLEVLRISGVTGNGVRELVAAMWQALSAEREREDAAAEGLVNDEV